MSRRAVPGPPPDGAEVERGSGDSSGSAPPAHDAGKAGKEKRVYVGTGFYWPVALGLVLAAGIVLLVLQNMDPVTLQWLWMDVDAPLVVLILITALATGLLTEGFGWVWRRRRRRVLRDREELKRIKR